MARYSSDSWKGEQIIINENDLFYDDNDAIKFIKGETIISKVLASEFHYTRSVGIIDENTDYE